MCDGGIFLSFYLSLFVFLLLLWLRPGVPLSCLMSYYQQTGCFPCSRSSVWGSEGVSQWVLLVFEFTATITCRDLACAFNKWKTERLKEASVMSGGECLEVCVCHVWVVWRFGSAMFKLFLICWFACHYTVDSTIECDRVSVVGTVSLIESQWPMSNDLHIQQ